MARADDAAASRRHALDAEGKESRGDKGLLIGSIHVTAEDSDYFTHGDEDPVSEAAAASHAVSTPHVKSSSAAHERALGAPAGLRAPSDTDAQQPVP